MRAQHKAVKTPPNPLMSETHPELTNSILEDLLHSERLITKQYKLLTISSNCSDHKVMEGKRGG
ncbi:hypothetical protein KIN20_034790 [Parelaphostrongylus tenuis]|uniref:Uncharacterized protein n=1 Tax=Parelaphostrongylus tenuis TaxID=148309 RepID=A0AAD5RD59_PARTN|nr:hypothetical protein KIN20_034790 [Parelaphostrongylus tenuis]